MAGLQHECHRCIGEKCEIHAGCEQFARMKAEELKQMVKVTAT